MLKVGGELPENLVLIERVCDNCGADLYKSTKEKSNVNEYCEICERIMRQSRNRKTKQIRKMRIYID